MKSKEKIEESVEYILQNKIKKCDLGIVIGTGLGGLVNSVNILLRSHTHQFLISQFQKWKCKIQELSSVR